MKTFETPLSVKLTWRFDKDALQSNSIGGYEARIKKSMVTVYERRSGGVVYHSHCQSREKGRIIAAKTIAKLLEKML